MSVDLKPAMKFLADMNFQRIEKDVSVRRALNPRYIPPNSPDLSKCVDALPLVSNELMGAFRLCIEEMRDISRDSDRAPECADPYNCPLIAIAPAN